MATAGAMQHTDFDPFTQAAESKNLAVSLSGQAAQAVVNSTVSAGISVAINGGNTKDFENAFVQSLAMNAVNKIGEKMAKKIGGQASGPAPKIGEAMRYIAHAGLGCALGVASSKVGDPDADVGVACGSGAVIGEFIAQEYTEDKLNPKQKKLLDLLKAEGFYDVDLSSMSLAEQAAYGQKFKNAQISPETLFRMQAIGVDFAKLGAGLAAFAAGGDVNIAANAGENAAKNNMLFLVPIAIALIKMAELALQAKELYDIYAVFENEGEAAGQDALRKYLEGKLEQKVIESLLPGVKLLSREEFVMKSCFRFLITFCGVAMVSAAASACPEYMKGEYRKLHSKESVDICALMENKTVLVVNTASHCGFTSQFKELEALHKKYKDRGLVVVGFASDDFKQEDADEEKAAEICYLNYGVTFTMFSPTHVTGKEANALFKALAEQAQEPKWNFNKYLMGKDGKLVEHFGSMTKPDSPKLAAAIERLL